jgi:hypothetical protein
LSDRIGKGANPVAYVREEVTQRSGENIADEFEEFTGGRDHDIGGRSDNYDESSYDGLGSGDGSLDRVAA